MKIQSILASMFVLAAACGGTGAASASPSSQPSTDAMHHAALDVKEDRKSTRLNSSHANISYAVFCLKKKNEQDRGPRLTVPAISPPRRARAKAPRSTIDSPS